MQSKRNFNIDHLALEELTGYVEDVDSYRGDQDAWRLSWWKKPELRVLEAYVTTDAAFTATSKLRKLERLHVTLGNIEDLSCIERLNNLQL